MTPDEVQIVGVAAGAALAVGVLGLLVARLLRRRSLRWQLALVAVVAVGGVLAGVLAIARLMFLSSHDLHVVTTVALVGGVVAVVVAILLGLTTTRRSEALREDVRRVGLGLAPRPSVSDDAPAELRALSTELELARARLDEARERERRLEDARREVVAWVSHDLRTPLAGIRAMAEAIDDGLAPDPTRYRRQIVAEVDRVVMMVDDLFELSRIHAGTWRPRPEHLDLADLVSDALATAEAAASARGVRLSGAVPDGTEVAADAAGLARVLDNLVANAVRHCEPGGTVEVRAREEGDDVHLDVLDACGGIPDDELARVFEPGWRGAQARPAGEAGTAGAGLGLAIVQGIVEAHRGSVALVNRGPGCQVTVRLPLAASS